MYYHDHANVLRAPLSPPGTLEREQEDAMLLHGYSGGRRLQLIAYLRALNAYRTRLAATLLREQYPNSVTINAAYVRALENYTLAITRLPSWCAPPSYVAEGF